MHSVSFTHTHTHTGQEVCPIPLSPPSVSTETKACLYVYVSPLHRCSCLCVCVCVCARYKKKIDLYERLYIFYQAFLCKCTLKFKSGLLFAGGLHFKLVYCEFISYYLRFMPEFVAFARETHLNLKTHLLCTTRTM